MIDMARQARLDAFAAALNAALERSPKTRTRVAIEVAARAGEPVGVTSLSNWSGARYAPHSVEIVWALEHVLDCRGELTGPLGYMPEGMAPDENGVAVTAADVEEALRAAETTRDLIMRLAALPDDGEAAPPPQPPPAPRRGRRQRSGHRDNAEGA